MPSNNKRTKQLCKQQQQTRRLTKTCYTCQASSTYRLPRGTHTTIFPGSSDQESCQNLDCNSLSLSPLGLEIKVVKKKRKWSMALRGGRGESFAAAYITSFQLNQVWKEIEPRGVSWFWYLTFFSGQNSGFGTWSSYFFLICFKIHFSGIYSSWILEL